MRRQLCGLTLILAALVATTVAQGPAKYEVWAIDQSSSQGRAFGGTVYIWNGRALENRHGAPGAPAEPRTQMALANGGGRGGWEDSYPLVTRFAFRYQTMVMG